MSDPKEIQHLFRKFLNNACTPEEFERLQGYLHEPDSSDYIRNMISDHAIEAQSLDDSSREGNPQVDRHFEKLLGRVEELDDTFKRPAVVRRMKWYSLAAALLLLAVSLISMYYWQGPQTVPKIAMTEKATMKGQKSTLILSDGTEIHLNAESKLTFPEHFTGGRREVVLEGEAFFDVTPDKARPFIIKTGNLTTTVVGTSFNIRSFSHDNTAVTVATGVVKVTSHPSSNEENKPGAMVLKPGQQAVYNTIDDMLTKKTVDIEKYTAWQEGTIIFDKATVREAVLKLERWYNVSFVYDEDIFKNCSFSARYKNESLKNVLESMRHILNLNYRITEDREVILRGKGCKTLNP